jgi:hypothetical protein
MKQKYKILGFYVQSSTTLKLQDVKAYPPSVPFYGVFSVDENCELDGSFDNIFGIADPEGKVGSDGTIEMTATYGDAWNYSKLGPVIIRLSNETGGLAGGWRGTLELKNQEKGHDSEKKCTVLCAIFRL